MDQLHALCGTDPAPPQTGAVFPGPLTDPSLDPLFVNPPRSGVPSAWYGHVPFAFWLMQALRPRLFVELGTHNGVSYAAFCEAAAASAIETRCFAVDTWQGDEHAGFYDETVFSSLQSFHDSRYSAFSRMLRTTFDDAAPYFADGSIDLLHIDGCHSYDAVLHDFETWRPKLSPRAVVVFHDTNVRERHFGVWRLWADLKTQYPAFEFVHEHGLGVLAVGPDVPDPARSLCSLDDPAATATIRIRFAQAGRRCAADASLALHEATLRTLAYEAAQSKAAHAAERDDLHRRLAETTAARDAATSGLASTAAHTEELRDHLHEREARIDAIASELHAARQESRRLHQVAAAGEHLAAHSRAALAAMRPELSLLDAARAGLAAAQAELAQAQSQAAALATQLMQADERHAAEQHRLHEHIRHVEHTLDSVTRSTVWRSLGPVRAAAAAAPRPVRRIVRRSLKAAWWSATPWRIPDRLRMRRELAALEQKQPVAALRPPAPRPLAPRLLTPQLLTPQLLTPQLLTPVAAPQPEAPFDRFALHLIPPLQGGYLPAIEWYDPDEPEVSIVVLNWNRGAMTLLCLQHLWQNTTGHRYEIIVVDNGSDPADLERLRDQAPLARIIPLGINKFFGEANNVGVEAARGRYVCLLNNDAFVAQGWLAPLVEILATDPKAGAAGPSFRYPNGTLQEAGALVNADGSAIQLGKGGRPDDPNYNAVRTVDYISAACILFRREQFLHVLGFDLAWDPAYYEDVDLCLKLRLIGLSTIFCPTSHIIHIEHATSVNQGAALKLNTIVGINRTKFVARWGRYLETMGQERPNLIPPPPSPLAPPSPLPLREGPGVGSSTSSKRVLIYTPYHLTPGGGERYILTIAEAFRGTADIAPASVAIVTPHPLSRVRLLTMGREFGLDLHHVELLTAADLHDRPPFDLAIVLGNEIFPGVSRMGLRNIYICQFPFPIEDPAYAAATRPFWNEFDLVLTYSEFVRSHVRRLAAELDLPPRRVEVLSPPVPLMAGSHAKRPGQILHVGRFFTGGHCKKQDAMIEAFRAMIEAGVKAELHFAGSTMPETEHRAYYLGLIDQARGLPIHFHANCSSEELRQLYAESAIYWHATGVGGDVGTAPHAVEHFGISIVEAMSARCLPIVFAAGGPATIVEDGVTGFHFQTIEQLAAKTREVLERADRATLDAMADAAEAAARAFDESSFKARVRDIAFGLIGAWQALPAEAAS